MQDSFELQDHNYLSDYQKLQGNWNYPTSISFGVGRSEELPATCEQIGISRPLIVTDNGLAELDFVQKMKRSCLDRGLHCSIFSDVKPNPTGTNIAAGVLSYKTGNHDGVIALGGGSGLDAAKAVALMAGQTRPIWDFEDVGDNWLRVDPEGIAPIIAVPTTSGTGSEVGRASVIVDEDNEAKKIIFHPAMLPQKVIADPSLTVGLPSQITAATGLDAFVHCLEAWCAPGFHPMADGIALEGMRFIKDWLPEAVANGDALIARSYLMIASSMGATAFQKGLGGIHALAHPLGAIYDKHHGLLNAIILPYVLIHNRQAIEPKIAHLARYLSLSQPDFSGFLDWVLKFRKELAIPAALSAIDISCEESEKIGVLAAADPSAAGNPINLSPVQYSQIFINAVNGNLNT